MSYIDFSLEKLKLAGYKLTDQRKAVLEVLEKQDKAISAYEIKEKLGKKSTLNVVTIYRILDLFAEIGLIHKVYTEEGFVKCNMLKSNGCHHFLVCKKCHLVEEFVDEGSCRKDFPKSQNFNPQAHMLEILGLCKKCA